MAKLTPKPVSASRVQLTQLMQNEHANLSGNVHGGWIMKLCDEAGGLAAMRHAQRQVVTVAIDSMTFQEPVRVGEVLHLAARLSWVGRSSMEVHVTVDAENPFSGDRLRTNSAFIVYVALDERGRPTPVSPLECETDEQRRRMEQGAQRQQQRLERRHHHAEE